MKFSQMKYERPDAEQLKAELNGLTEKLKAAKSYTEAKELFLAEEKLNKHISTLANLAHIRHTIDTRDAFYDGEMKFWNKVDPELEECPSRAGPRPCWNLLTVRTLPKSTAT